MFKKIFAASLAAVLTLGASAQEKLYLVKDNEVVAKYNVADVDYVTFNLPSDVIDDTDSQPGIINRTYKSAMGIYFGTTDDVADYQIQLSSRGIADENIPVDFLYLQLMGPAADFHDLYLPEGTYTVQQGEARKAFTYYAGVRQNSSQGTMIGGTLILDRPTAESQITNLVEGGTFTVTKDGNAYKIAGILKLENGSVLEFNYSGSCVIDNQSDEKDPAEEVSLPESSLTEDMEFPTFDVYWSTFGKLWADAQDRVYNYLWFYDSNYEECLEVGFFVDAALCPDGKFFIPKGKYQVVKKGSTAFNSDQAGALYPFGVMSDTGVARYGCWMVTNYADASPLVAGEVELLEDYDGSGMLNIKINLQDNAQNPHTVSGSYNGVASKL